MLKNLMQKIRNRKGFTLIELIVVIAILGILALIAIPKFSTFQEDARKKADLANAKNVASVISTLVANNKITADVAVAAACDGDATIAAAFPGGVPTCQTTAVKGHKLYYTVVVSTGVVTIYSETPGTHKLYPETHDAIFD